jgi:hypothetical protein
LPFTLLLLCHLAWHIRTQYGVKKKKTLKYLQVPEYSYESSNQRLLLFHSDLLIPGSSIKNLSFKNMEQLERINYYGSSQHEVDFPSCLKDFLKLWK